MIYRVLLTSVVMMGVFVSGWLETTEAVAQNRRGGQQRRGAASADPNFKLDDDDVIDPWEGASTSMVLSVPPRRRSNLFGRTSPTGLPVLPSGETRSATEARSEGRRRAAAEDEELDADTRDEEGNYPITEAPPPDDEQLPPGHTRERRRGPQNFDPRDRSPEERSDLAERFAERRARRAHRDHRDQDFVDDWEREPDEPFYEHQSSGDFYDRNAPLDYDLADEYWEIVDDPDEIY